MRKQYSIFTTFLVTFFLTCVCLFEQLPAATITAVANGCWASNAIWDLGRIPANTDDVALAGYIVTTIGNGTSNCVDVPAATIPLAGSLNSISSVGTAGQIEIKLDDEDCHGGCSLAATTITAGTKPATGGVLLITGTTDHVLSLVTGTGAGEGLIGGTNIDAWGGNNAGTGTVNLTGRVTGGSTASTCYGYRNGSTGAFTLNGDVYGGGNNSSYGVYQASTGTFTLNGDSYAGTSASCNGVTAAGASTNYINGNVYGSATRVDAYGIQAATTSQFVLSATTQLINGAKSVAYYGASPAWTSPTTGGFKSYVGAGYSQAANTLFPQQVAAENLKAGVVSGAVTGTLQGGSPRFGDRTGGK